MVSNARQFHDVFATLVHFISLWFFIEAFQKFASPAVTALFVMQSVSFLFHASYVYLYFFSSAFYQSLLQPQNKIKWVEYGISATAGAVAIIYSNETPSIQFLIALILMSTFQQYLGSVIDRRLQFYQPPTTESPNFFLIYILILFASALQIAEFLIVSFAGSPPFTLFLSYVIGWSLFGIHCGIHAAVLSQLSVRTNQNVPNNFSYLFLRYSNRDWVESIYSCLGWGAKITVFATEYVYLKNDRSGSDELDHVAISVGVLSLVGLLITFMLPPNEAANINTSFL